MNETGQSPESKMRENPCCNSGNGYAVDEPIVAMEPIGKTTGTLEHVSPMKENCETIV